MMQILLDFLPVLADCGVMSKASPTSTEYIHRAIGASAVGGIILIIAAFCFDWRIGVASIAVFFFWYSHTCQTAAGLVKIDEEVERRSK